MLQALNRFLIQPDPAYLDRGCTAWVPAHNLGRSSTEPRRLRVGDLEIGNREGEWPMAVIAPNWQTEDRLDTGNRLWYTHGKPSLLREKLVVDIPLYHKREGYAVGKVQFSDFGNDFQVRCTKLTLASSYCPDCEH